MSSINKVILIGNLGRDPETKAMPNGDCLVNLAVATSESWKDKSTGEKKEKTEWHRVVVFRRLAEICSEFLTKGSKVYIEGKIQTRKYDKNGVETYSTEIVAHEMRMLDSKGAANTQAPKPVQQNVAPAVAFDDDIPF